MNKSTPALLGVIALVILPGCQESVYVRPVQDKSEGAVYSLPKVVLKVKITYTVMTTTTMVNGVEVNDPKERPTVEVVKPIVVEPVILPDRENTFTISGRDISDNILLESGLEFKINANGTLQSVSAEVTDKTLEAVEAVATAGIHVAKILALAGGPEVDARIKPVVDRMDLLFKEISTAVSGGDPDKLKKLEALTKELNLLNGAIQVFVQGNKRTRQTKEIEYSIAVDPSGFEEEGKTLVKKITPDGLVEDVPSGQMPEIKIILHISQKECKERTKPFFDKPDPKNSQGSPQKGIVYRVPAPILTEVFVKNTPVFAGHLYYPQFGSYAVVAVESKGFSKQKTSATIDATTGGLTSYKVESGSSGDKAFEKLGKIMGDLEGSLLDIRFGLKAQELEKKKALLDAEKGLKQAELDLLKARQELEEYKKNHP